MTSVWVITLQIKIGRRQKDSHRIGIRQGLFIFFISWEDVTSAWSYREGSRESGGIDAVFLLKTLLLIMPAAVLLQGLAQILRSLLIISGKLDSSASQQSISS